MGLNPKLRATIMEMSSTLGKFSESWTLHCGHATATTSGAIAWMSATFRAFRSLDRTRSFLRTPPPAPQQLSGSGSRT